MKNNPSMKLSAGLLKAAAVPEKPRPEPKPNQQRPAAKPNQSRPETKPNQPASGTNAKQPRYIHPALLTGGLGALAGGAIGAGSALFAKKDKGKKALKRALLGALLGGGAGAALPYGLVWYLNRNAKPEPVAKPPVDTWHQARVAREEYFKKPVSTAPVRPENTASQEWEQARRQRQEHYSKQ